MNQMLACTVDLRSHVTQACWNVKGTDFVLLHVLFATMATELDAYADLVAERIAVPGGVTWGTARMAATQSMLPAYPSELVEGKTHVLALAERFAFYATALRAGIAHATDVEEAGSAAVYSDISRGIEKRLWFLEAHLHQCGKRADSQSRDGRLREVHEHFGWDLQDEDVETMAGYIMKRLGRTAHVVDTIDTPYGTMRVENMARVRITQVAIVRIPPTATEEYAD